MSSPIRVAVTCLVLAVLLLFFLSSRGSAQTADRGDLVLVRLSIQPGTVDAGEIMP